MKILVLIPLVILLMIPLSAHADILTYSIKNIYTVHVAHVGDTIVIVNNDTIAHTIDGNDQSNELISSGVLQPGEQFQMEFLFPGEFAFYDKLHYNTTGIFYLVDPNEPLPTNVYNHTSISDLYSKPVYLPSVRPPTTQVNTTQTTNQTTVQPIEDQSQPSFNGFSNATLSLGDNSNATYWEQQANMWETKYNNLLNELKNLANQ